MSKNELKASIRFNNADAKMNIPARREIKNLLLAIFDDNNQPLASLQYVLCSDDYLIDLNRRFLNHDTYTDIISFAMSEPGQPVEGEIYISVDRIKENALSLGTTPQAELSRVIFHGALHLCGYKDKSAAQKNIMRAQEDHYLSRLR